MERRNLPHINSPDGSVYLSTGGSIYVSAIATPTLSLFKPRPRGLKLGSEVMLAPSCSGMERSRVQFDAKCLNHFQNGVKPWCSVTGQRLVKALS